MKLKEALEKKKFVVTSEVQAPMGDDDPEALVENLKRVRGRMDGVSIAEVELEGVVGDSIRTCELLNANRFDAIYQTTTRDKNRIQLQKDLTSGPRVRCGKPAGVHRGLSHLRRKPAGDHVLSCGFGQAGIGSGAPEGWAHGGRQGTGEKVEFIMGSGVESLWGKNVPKQGMQEMEAMREMGTGYFLTTPIFDLDQFQKFLKQVKTFDVPVIAEVMLLRNAAMARFINRHFKAGLIPDWVVQKLDKAPDKKKASIELFADTIKGLRDICDGVHIITLGRN
jgi:methylenetetrahydrofolate reductase (NADPH)